MYKILLIFICNFLIINNDPVYTRGENYTGYIFDKNHFTLLKIENQLRRYTPSSDDILLAENILKNNIKCFNRDLINQGNGCPIIHKKTKKYIRQYLGYINNDNEKIIWINFIWKNEFPSDRISKDIINAFDGCSYYWNIKVNINKKSLNDLQINGRG